ncbi:MAG: IS66 family transposase [Planctomycetes bacterium]|nr:IS66 family transposase [Planctomycetota bacterium]
MSYADLKTKSLCNELKKTQAHADKSRQRLNQARSSFLDEKHRLKLAYKRDLAAQAETIRKKEKERFEKRYSKLQDDYNKQLAQLKNKIVEQDRELQLYRDKFKGRSKKEVLKNSSSVDGLLGSAKTQSTSKDAKKKGKRLNTPGSGRKLHSELPGEEQIHELPEDQCQCSVCGGAFKDSALFEEREEIDYQVIVKRVIHKRKVYRTSCNCPGPSLLTTPKAPRALTKGKYSDNFYLEALLAKYHYQIPYNVFIKQVADHGLKGVKASTLCKATERIDHFMQPLYDAIVAESKKANHWHSDESRLGVFIPRDDGKKSYNYALFQHATAHTVVFALTPMRDASHLIEYFCGLEGTVNADRAGIYKKMAKELEGIIIAFCWVHVRRDFIKCGRYTKGSRGWALKYLKIISRLFHLNKQRLASVDCPESFLKKDRKLRLQLQKLQEMSQQELLSDKLKSERRTILNSLQRHWQGLNVFVDNPTIPMDNNLVERRFRVLARFRHNCYGVFSEKFGQITARMLSIFATLELCGLNVRAYLELYFSAVAENNGRAPEKLDALLPWKSKLQERLQKRPLDGSDTS